MGERSHYCPEDDDYTYMKYRFTCYCFQTVWPCYILSFFNHLLCLWKISFWCSESFKSLAHSFCFFSFAEEITSSCTPSMPLSSFLSSNFHTLSSFLLLLQQLPHSTTTMFPYVCMALWHSKYVPCCFHHIFHLLPVFKYITLLPLLWPCFGIPHVFSSLSFHRHTLGWNVLCHLFVALNCMSITMVTRSHPEMVGDMSHVTWTLTYQKFLLCVSSQGQDLYSHQKLNM